MAINGLFPVLLVGLDDALTPVQSNELNKLLALANPSPEQLIRIDALKELSSVSSLIPRVPIILDGEIMKAQPSGYSTTMVKQLSVYGDNTVGVKSAANTVSISIMTKSSKNGISIFPDIIFSIADIIFSKKDNVPRISYFGDNIIIPNGYITRISKSSTANSEREVITLEIQKDIESQDAATVEKDKTVSPFKVASDWIAS